MCSGSDAVKTVISPITAVPTILGSLFKPPQMPDVVRTDPVADQAKTETDAAQAAQNASLQQKRSARRNSLLSAAGAVGDTSAPAPRRRPCTANRTSGADHVRRNRRQSRSNKVIVGSGGDAPVVGQPDTAKTQIGDSGAAAVVGQKRKPRSLLSGTALGDSSAAPVAAVTAKPTLGG
jgi:hypothetical protein